MGMPSFLEDIQKARDDAIHFRRLLADNVLLDGPTQRLVDQARQQIPGYLRILDDAISHFDRILELATDPSMDLAEEVVRLRGEIADTKENAEERVLVLKQRLEAEISAAATSKRNFRDELKKRELGHKKAVADITRRHTQALDRQRTAHQIEKNGWQKQLDELATQSARTKHETRTLDSDVEFGSALPLFDPTDEDIR